MGAANFALTRRLLDGASKTAFENAAQLQGAHTNTIFQECLREVTEDVPPKALLNQKPFMRRFLRKLVEMTAKDYIARVCKINSYLTAFPTKPDREAAKLPTDELLNLLEFGSPSGGREPCTCMDSNPKKGQLRTLLPFANVWNPH